MTTELATKDIWGVMEKVVVEGDLSRLSPKEKVEYYRQFCESLGLNPLTRPFDYIRLNGKEVLYAKKDATEQLRRKYGVSCTIPSRELTGGVYVVTARATDASGRADESIGAVSVEGLKGDALANAYMKAETKAKRRVTLSICGLGLLDETEVETISGATRLVAGDNQTVEVATGEIIPKPMNHSEFAAWLSRMNVQPGDVAKLYGKPSIKAYVEELKAAGNPDPLRTILKDYVTEVKPGGYEWFGTEPVEAEDVPFGVEAGK